MTTPQLATTTVTLPRWVLYHLMVTYVAILLVVGAGVWYVQSTVASEGRKECGVYTLLDGAYAKAPPTTATGRQFAAAIHNVVTDLGCEE
jgi:hypothetical protein